MSTFLNPNSLLLASAILIASTSAIPQNAAIKCTPGTAKCKIGATEYDANSQQCKNAVYRYEGNTRRWYPSPAIAASWDPAWSSASLQNCAAIAQGTDMKLRVIPQNAPIKCFPGTGACVIGQKGFNANSPECKNAVYRYVGNTRRWYPSPAIAASWDPAWATATLENCASISQGADMKLYVIPAEGTSIKCLAGTAPCVQGGVSYGPNSAQCANTPVYRFSQGKRRWFPTPAIAATWDDKWFNAVTLDCTKFSQGLDMAKYANPREGTSIRCLASTGSCVVNNKTIAATNPTCNTLTRVYRFTANTRRYYPTAVIGKSWDSNWERAAYVDCLKIAQGADMEIKPAASSSASAKATATASSTMKATATASSSVRQSVTSSAAKTTATSESNPSAQVPKTYGTQNEVDPSAQVPKNYGTQNEVDPSAQVPKTYGTQNEVDPSAQVPKTYGTQNEVDEVPKTYGTNESPSSEILPADKNVFSGDSKFTALSICTIAIIAVSSFTL